MDLNNRRTDKHATKPRALGLLGHSVLCCSVFFVVVKVSSLHGDIQENHKITDNVVVHSVICVTKV